MSRKIKIYFFKNYAIITSYEYANKIQNYNGTHQNYNSFYYAYNSDNNYFKNNLKKLLTNRLKSPIIYLLIERETTERETNSRDSRQGKFRPDRLSQKRTRRTSTTSTRRKDRTDLSTFLEPRPRMNSQINNGRKGKKRRTHTPKPTPRGKGLIRRDYIKPIAGLPLSLFFRQ